MRISDWSSDVCSSDLGVSEIGQKEVFVAKRYFVRQASRAGVRAGFCNAFGIDVDADALCATIPRRRDHDAPIARSQIIANIPGANRGQIEDEWPARSGRRKIGREPGRERWCQYVYISVYTVI